MRISCDKCESLLRVDDRLLGGCVRCPRCHSLTRVSPHFEDPITLPAPSGKIRVVEVVRVTAPDWLLVTQAVVVALQIAGIIWALGG